jgi:hypothetical protein
VQSISALRQLVHLFPAICDPSPTRNPKFSRTSGSEETHIELQGNVTLVRKLKEQERKQQIAPAYFFCVDKNRTPSERGASSDPILARSHRPTTSDL